MTLSARMRQSWTRTVPDMLERRRLLAGMPGPKTRCPTRYLGMRCVLSAGHNERCSVLSPYHTGEQSRLLAVPTEVIQERSNKS